MKDDDDPGDDSLEKLFRALDVLKEDLEALRDKEAEMNSMYPATRAFLRGKGVTNVMELTPEDRQELMAYLKAELDAALAKGPSNRFGGFFWTHRPSHAISWCTRQESHMPRIALLILASLLAFACKNKEAPPPHEAPPPAATEEYDSGAPKISVTAPEGWVKNPYPTEPPFVLIRGSWSLTWGPDTLIRLTWTDTHGNDAQAYAKELTEAIQKDGYVLKGSEPYGHGGVAVTMSMSDEHGVVVRPLKFVLMPAGSGLLKLNGYWDIEHDQLCAAAFDAVLKSIHMP